MQDIVSKPDIGSGTYADLSVVVLGIALSLALGAATLRRRTP
jgi:hypothetical protein